MYVIKRDICFCCSAVVYFMAYIWVFGVAVEPETARSKIVIYSKFCYVSPHMSEMEIKEPKNTWFL